MIQLTGKNVDMESTWKVAYEMERVELSSDSRERMTQSRNYIELQMNLDEIMYGVNTGFGHFSDVVISASDIKQLQVNIIRSHSVGVGAPFTPEEVRAIMCLRANALCSGHSGCRPIVVEKILEFLNKNIIPVIPQQGSVGASGDLAPLSHLALSLIGEAYVWWKGKKTPTGEVLRECSVKPLILSAKEGLSLINGCQVMTAVGLLNGYKGRRLSWILDLAGAMSLEALRGSRSAFDPLISATRPHVGEAKTARNLLKILGESSSIGDSHKDCSRVQDAYSLRCMPAVHGAGKDTIAQTIKTLEIEANSSTDNPLVFVEEQKVLSCGNFHGEPIAFALDFMAIAVSSMSSMSECRIAKLVNPSMSGLPAFLTPKGGLNSGMMLVHVAAASLVSENKILSHPASVDSIPTSADKEDHVSMGTIAARKLSQVINNAESIVSMELLCASQGLGLLAPLTPAAGVKAAYEVISKEVPFVTEDRVFSEDIEKIGELIRNNVLLEALHGTVGGLEC